MNTINRFLNLVFLSLLSIPRSLIDVEGRVLPDGEGGSGGIVPSDGICSTAVIVHGFKCREYDVTTDDGYILSVQRIPEGRAGGDGGQTRQPVLLQHGLLVDGMTWLKNSPEQSLAMMLADHGFDVWISNLRGTRFSRRHDSLDPTSSEFWNWSWDELVIHDLPSVIDFVSKQTGQQIHYAGHSMGTLIAMASLSEDKFKNVKSAALLSPVAYTSNVTSPLLIAGARSFIGEIGQTYGIPEFDPNGQEATRYLVETICSLNVKCGDLMTELTGKNCCLNETTVKNFLEDDLQPSSTKNMVHLSQGVRSGVVAKYDYGVVMNLQNYGAAQPPVYDLSKIPSDFPLFISYGGQDAMADVKDVGILLDILRSTHDEDKMEVRYIEEYAHVDFIMAVNANGRVYNHIVDFFRKYD
ncbi:hypothetical protein OROMI_027587 [Orobanche minor]